MSMHVDMSRLVLLLSVCMKKKKCCRVNLLPIARILRIISEPSRLNILCLLKKKELCVCELQALLGQPHNLVCHHLKNLAGVGLVVARKNEGFTYYSLAKAKYIKMIREINQLLGDAKCLTV